MNKIYMEFLIYLNGKKVSNSQCSSTSPTDVKRVNRLTKILVHYLLALLLNALEIQENSIQVGNLSVKVICGSTAIKVMDVNGVLPVNEQEIVELLEKNSISKKLENIVLDDLLSKHSEGQP